ncbi:MAG: hypothetical protein IIB94_09805 [Candidatus Marinimicrobia bacterium]|nr:hypothetical protein [Candidatus Neomarinimicrobiota bacterium]
MNKIIRGTVVALCFILIGLRSYVEDFVFDDISLWLFLIAVIVILIPDIGELVNRIKKFKKGNLEIEFEKHIASMTIQTDLAEQKLEESDIIKEDREIPENVRAILAESSRNPRGALITLAVEIERALELLAEKYDITNKGRYFSPRYTLEGLIKIQKIPQTASLLFLDFWEIRNQAVHDARFNLDQNRLYELVSIGFRILKLLYSI